MSYGIKVARPNYSVTDPNLTNQNLVFSSLLSACKIYRVVFFETAGTVAHGLTYPPLFFAMLYVETDDAEYEYSESVGDDIPNDPQLTAGTWVASMGSGSFRFLLSVGNDVTVDDTNVTSTLDNVAVILCIDPLNE